MTGHRICELDPKSQLPTHANEVRINDLIDANLTLSCSHQLRMACARHVESHRKDYCSYTKQKSKFEYNKI